MRHVRPWRTQKTNAKARLKVAASPRVEDLPLKSIRRPLGRTRSNDATKVAWLMDSIAEVGLQVPIDVLEVEGVYYGFSGCHRFEAHQRLGLETIKCKVRKATRKTLEMHLR